MLQVKKKKSFYFVVLVFSLLLFSFETNFSLQQPSVGNVDFAESLKNNLDFINSSPEKQAMLLETAQKVADNIKKMTPEQRQSIEHMSKELETLLVKMNNNPEFINSSPEKQREMLEAAEKVAEDFKKITPEQWQEIEDMAKVMEEKIQEMGEEELKKLMQNEEEYNNFINGFASDWEKKKTTAKEEKKPEQQPSVGNVDFAESLKNNLDFINSSPEKQAMLLETAQKVADNIKKMTPEQRQSIEHMSKELETLLVEMNYSPEFINSSPEKKALMVQKLTDDFKEITPGQWQAIEGVAKKMKAKIKVETKNYEKTLKSLLSYLFILLLLALFLMVARLLYRKLTK